MHSLRIKVTSQTSSGKEPSTQPLGSSSDDSSNSSSTIAKGDESLNKDKDLTGRINNLLSADINALEEGQAFLLNSMSRSDQMNSLDTHALISLLWTGPSGFQRRISLHDNRVEVCCFTRYSPDRD